MLWAPLIWLGASLALLLLAERWIHRHLQGVALLLTGSPRAAVVLYALPLLPGILLHEISHALAGRLLGVRVGRISVRPKLIKGRIQLGSVPVERTDALRASLIGLAPLGVGSAAILLIGYFVFGIETLGQALLNGELNTLWAELTVLARTPDAWLWAYAIFAISNTMLPSPTDRQAWPPVLLFLLVCALLAGVVTFVSGQGTWVAEHLGRPVTTALRWLAVACTFTVGVDLPFMAVIALLERLLSRLSGMEIEY